MNEALQILSILLMVGNFALVGRARRMWGFGFLIAYNCLRSVLWITWRDAWTVTMFLAPVAMLVAACESVAMVGFLGPEERPMRRFWFCWGLGLVFYAAAQWWGNSATPYRAAFQCGICGALAISLAHGFFVGWWKGTDKIIVYHQLGLAFYFAALIVSSRLPADASGHLRQVCTITTESMQIAALIAFQWLLPPRAPNSCRMIARMD